MVHESISFMHEGMQNKMLMGMNKRKKEKGVDDRSGWLWWVGDLSSLREKENSERNKTEMGECTLREWTH